LVNTKILNSFIKALKEYSYKNKIGLALIVSEEISRDVYDLVHLSTDDVAKKIILVEKPTIVI